MENMKRVLKYGSGRFKYCIASIACAMIAGLLVFVPVSLVFLFLKTLYLNENYGISPVGFGIGIVCAILLYAFFYFCAQSLSHVFGFRVERNMRKYGVHQLLNVSLSFFDTHTSGSVRKTIDDNASETHTLVAHLIPDITLVLTTPIALILMYFILDLNVQFLLLMLLFFVLTTITILTLLGQTEFRRKYVQAQIDMNAEAIEYVRGMQVIKSFKASIFSMKKFHDSIKTYGDMALKYTESAKGLNALNETIIQSFIIFVIPIVYGMIISIGQGYLGIVYAVFYIILFSQLTVLIDRIRKVRYDAFRAVESVKGLERLFSGESYIRTNETLSDLQGFDIEFEHVSFSYDGVHSALKDISYHFEQGKSYALVGESGSGKSTLAKLIAGYYTPQSGQLKIGGVDLKEISRHDLNRMIGYVFQHPQLFEGSIYYNVLCANPEASYDEVMVALHHAQCDAILDKFPAREETIVGTKGVYLSGGERQLIMIARNILKDSPIVVMDEATAAADPENEYEIQKALSSLIVGKTVIIIAHRLSSIRDVDEVIVLSQGNIVETGTHEALMNQDSKYHALHTMYEIAKEWGIQHD